MGLVNIPAEPSSALRAARSNPVASANAMDVIARQATKTENETHMRLHVMGRLRFRIDAPSDVVR